VQQPACMHTYLKTLNFWECLWDGEVISPPLSPLPNNNACGIFFSFFLFVDGGGGAETELFSSSFDLKWGILDLLARFLVVGLI